MKNNNSDFISLTAAVRRARSEGLELSYACGGLSPKDSFHTCPMVAIF